MRLASVATTLLLTLVSDATLSRNASDSQSTRSGVAQLRGVSRAAAPRRSRTDTMTLAALPVIRRPYWRPVLPPRAMSPAGDRRRFEVPAKQSTRNRCAP